MNRIRQAAKQERFESGNHESRRSKQFRHVLVSWIPDSLIFSCVPAFLIASSSSAAADVVIGSKKFTESYVLGEIAKRTLTDAGIPAEHRQGMGGTIILWEALRGGQIDAYPEYTGTITTEILKSDSSLNGRTAGNPCASATICHNKTSSGSITLSGTAHSLTDLSL
jgi:hypothetical protein